MVGMLSLLSCLGRLLAVIALIWLAFPAPSLAEEDDAFGLQEADPELPAKIKKWNADCLSCHTAEGARNPPRQGMDLALLARLIQDQGIFEASDHGKMACKDCHTEAYAPYPHLPKAKDKIKGCEECHQQPAKIIVPEFKASVHAKELGTKFSCLSCHESHTMRKASKLGSPHKASIQDNERCRTCHDSDKAFAAWKPDKKRPDMDKVHDWLPNLDRHLAQVRCQDCHSPVSDLALSHEIQPKAKATRQCEACHAEDGELGKRLYKPLLKNGTDPQAGFSRAPWLSEIYVVGANRNAWIEWAALAAALTVLILVLIRALSQRGTRN